MHLEGEGVLREEGRRMVCGLVPLRGKPASSTAVIAAPACRHQTAVCNDCGEALWAA